MGSGATVRRFITLAAVLLCLLFAACNDRENANQGNPGSQPSATGAQTANPSTLESTGPAETTATTGP